ncbi:hypothetical protein BGZ49_004422 [Haplosporangium sp. Z 27]|nr:hypothetical protein BGZ49_004422 [Haplosporangium sp. Z 27]
MFLHHHVSKVQRLSIPITHLEPYFKYIHQLKNLRSIQFYEDELDGTQDQDFNQIQDHAGVIHDQRDDLDPIQELGLNEESSIQTAEQVSEIITDSQDAHTLDNLLNILDGTIANQENNVNEADQGNTEDIEETAQAEPVFNPTPRALYFLRLHRELFNPSCIPESINHPPNHRRLADQYQYGYGLLEVEPPSGWIRPSWNGTLRDEWYTSLLGALESPGMIDFEYWTNFAYHLKNTPLTGIKRLRSFCGDIPEANWDQSKLLQRCRSLESFSSILRGPDVFKWAVEERKDRIIYETLLQGGIACAPTSLAQGTSHSQFFGPGQVPVPLRRVVLRRGDDEFVVPVLKDICFSFEETLEWIEVRTRTEVSSIPTSIFCNMPWLTVLDIHTNMNCPFVSDISFLDACPALKRLRLIDYIEDQSNAIGTTICIQKPWYLPKLQELVLVGTMCNAFNYETLTYTRDIQVIRLERAITDFGVRAVDKDYRELLLQHTWSWNWSLPRLHTLKLTGLPAHLFRLCLLEHCPKLQRLSLDLGQVPRFVSEERDLKKIVISSIPFQSPIRSLTLKGRWILTETEDLFQLFLQEWFSNLQYLKVGAAQFSSNNSIIDGLKSLKCLRKSNFIRHSFSEYDAWKLGLEEVGFKCSREWDIKHHVEISIFDARERRIMDREKQKEYEAWIEKQTKRMLEYQDYLDIMSTAFVVLNAMGDSEDYHCDDVPDQSYCKVESMKSDMEKQQLIIEEKIQREQEANDDLLLIMKCVYVFNGKRYHFE